MLVSVCMIVKNEESNIVRALSSIPSNYEKIVVDTGSTDQTVKLATNFGANVYSYTWCDDFAAARNIALSYCTGEYILVIDADEQLPADTIHMISSFISHNPKQCGAVLIENLIEDEVNRHRMIRFFPNDPQYQYVGMVHEQLYKDDQPASIIPLDLVITHFGYDKTYYLERNKADVYLSLYQKHLHKHPHNGYMLYQTGKLYYSLEDYKNAEHYFELCLEQNEVNHLYFPVMLVMLGNVLKEQGEFILAEQLLNNYKQYYPDFPDIPFLLGLIAMETGKIHIIEQSYLHALDIGETTKYSSTLGVGSYKAAYNLGLFYELTGSTERAKHYYNLSADFDFAPAKERLAFLV
ncbi:glycosyltransferase [Paenibacillus terrigena]|uniref:tetratricopeptide repeat-containing glycosyltransferase family 2 protein n=1 Tax=Paenibacillus terrigena TaxID=369333 RepID=UPI0028D6A125|nr:glycosyltransferase [Paenibacillus terrigena]